MLITSKDNPKVKLYRKLAASRKARTEMGLFVAEGMRGIVDIAGEADIEAVFCTEAALEKYSGVLDTGRLALIPGDRRYTVTDEVADKMSEVGSTQGVFAIVKRLDLPLGESVPAGNVAFRRSKPS